MTQVSDATSRLQLRRRDERRRRGRNWLIGTLALALVLGAAYTLWMFKRVYLGPVTNDNVKNLKDINNREFLMLALLAIAVLYMGIYPKPFTDVMDTSVAELLKHVALSKLN
mgnify:CR=1 FL=1